MASSDNCIHTRTHAHIIWRSSKKKDILYYTNDCFSVLCFLQSEPEGFSHFHLYVCAAFLIKWRKEILDEEDFQVNLLKAVMVGEGHNIIILPEALI